MVGVGLLPPEVGRAYLEPRDTFARPAVETVGGVTRYLACPERSEWMWEGDGLLLEVNPVSGAVATRHVWGAGGYQGYYLETSLTRLAVHERLLNRVRAVTPPLGA